MTRGRALSAAAAPERIEAARAEAARFSGFREQLGLKDDVEAVSLYITHLGDQSNGAAVRRRLQSLDLERRLRGVEPWLADRDVRALLRGLHHNLGRGAEGQGHYDPLYIELVHAMLDATYVPTLWQRRAVAAMILYERTELSVAALARLTWGQVHLTKRQVTISVVQRLGRGQPSHRDWRLPSMPTGEACPVVALSHLPASRFVVVDKDGAWDRDRLHADLAPLLTREAGPNRLRLALADALRLSPLQYRDRALLTMGYAAGLRTGEAGRLLQGDIEIREGGLVAKIAGRRRVTPIPRAHDDRRDPVTAWQAWLACMASQDKTGPQRPAFPTCNHTVIEDRPLAAQGLNLVVRQRCEQAALDGRYVWTSLRTGMMRTALRADADEWAVASQADLTSLGSVHRHERRENLLRHSVAGRLGL